MTQELYKKYRPKTLKQVVGQDPAIKVLQGLLKKGLPHTILFTGPSGCGKTTLARILAIQLGCSQIDLVEINCANFRGIDTVREISQRMNLAPMGGEARVYIIDECHKLSNDAQNAMLKILEDTPAHVYFLLATTEPEKLIKTILTRCTRIALSAIASSSLTSLIYKVCEAQNAAIDEEVAEKIVEVAEGSARQALIILEQVLTIEEPDTEGRLNVVQSVATKRQAIELARILFNPKAKWKDVAKVLQDLDKNEDVETLRRMILGYARSVLLKSGQQRAFEVIEIFRDNFFDSGTAGLTAACFEVVSLSKGGDR